MRPRLTTGLPLIQVSYRTNIPQNLVPIYLYGTFFIRLYIEYSFMEINCQLNSVRKLAFLQKCNENYPFMKMKSLYLHEI